MGPHYYMHEKYMAHRTREVERKVFLQGLILNQHRPRYFARPPILVELREMVRTLPLRRLFWLPARKVSQ